MSIISGIMPALLSYDEEDESAKNILVKYGLNNPEKELGVVSTHTLIHHFST
jgi:hypothetical protein